MPEERLDSHPRLTRRSPLAQLLLFACMASTFSAALVWIALTPRLDDPVDWLCKLAAAVPVLLNLAAIVLASRLWRRQ